MKAYRLVGTLLLFPLSGLAKHAGPRISVDTTAKLPELVNLARQFPEETPKQGDFGTCSYYASVGSLEAACFRATKKSFNFSEALPILLGARGVLQHSDNPFRYGDKYHLFPIPWAEVGLPAEVLKELLEGNVVTEDVFSVEKHLIPLTERLKKTAEQKLKDGVAWEEVERAYLEELDAEIVKHGLKVKRKKKSYDLTSTDPKVKECLTALAPPVHWKNVPSEELKQILAAGIPITCTYGHHAFVLAGYQGAGAETKWSIRNSHEKTSFWEKLFGGAKGCQSVDLLLTKEEAARFKPRKNDRVFAYRQTLPAVPPKKALEEEAEAPPINGHIPVEPTAFTPPAGTGVPPPFTLPPGAVPRERR